MKKIKLTIALLPIILAFNTHAATFSDEYSKCMEQSNGVTADMLDCISKEIKYQDILLNLYYKKARENLDSKGKKLLLTEQRAWLKFRDARVAFISGTSEGSMATLQTDSTFLEMLGNRVDELKDISENY